MKTLKQEIKNSRNGFTKNWHSAYYVICNTFTVDEIAAMTEKELEMLVRLVEAIQDALY